MFFIILEVPWRLCIILEPTCESAGKDPGCCEQVFCGPEDKDCVSEYCEVELGDETYCYCELNLSVSLRTIVAAMFKMLIAQVSFSMILHEVFI